MEQLLVTEKIVKTNKNLKLNGKSTLRSNRRVKGSTLKMKVGKLVSMANENAYLDLVGDTQVSDQRKVVSVPTNINELMDCIEQKQICGMSGSGFPTVEKIQTLLTSKAPSKYLVINAVACDPGLLQDDWLLYNKLEQIEKGIEVIAGCITFDRIVLATKLDVTKHNVNARYEIVRVPDRYPMGEERILINQVLNRTIPADKVPAAQGVLEINVQTIYAIYQAAYHDQMLNSRYLTAADLETGAAVIIRAKQGSDIQSIVSKVWIDYLKKNPQYLKSSSVYCGGGLFSAHPMKADEKVTLTTNFIAVGSAVQFSDSARCKGCGACKRHCPMGVNVAKAVKAIEKGNDKKAESFGAKNCIQCGACSYYCRAGKNTMRTIGMWKEQR